MFQKEGTWDMSFAGSGYMGIYHLGVVSCLRERAPFILQGTRRFYGSSVGSLCCLGILDNRSADFCCSNLMDLVREIQKRSIGIFHPSFDGIDFVKRRLQKHLPDDIHKVASQRMGISLTRLPDMKNVIVTHFATRDELIQFRGERYVDGALSNNIPFPDSKETITVSPFYGTLDISPESNSASIHELNLCNGSFQMCLKNFHAGVLSLFPPEPKVLANVCRQGYLDTLRFLERRGLTKQGVIRNLLSGVPCSLESNGQRTSGNEEEKKSGEVQINWNVPNVLVKDIAKFELLSPELEAALQKSCEQPSGFLARFSRSPPVKILTYTFLPCTVTSVYVYVKSKKLITWIPEAPDDIRWMHHEFKKFSCFVFSEVKDRLLGSAWLQNFSSSVSSTAMQPLLPQPT